MTAGEGFTHYDAHGNITGRTTPSVINGYNHYDSQGNKTGTSSGVPLFDHYSRNGSDLSPTNIGYREPAYRDITRPEWTKSVTEVADDQFYGTDQSKRPETYGTSCILPFHIMIFPITDPIDSWNTSSARPSSLVFPLLMMIRCSP